MAHNVFGAEYKMNDGLQDVISAAVENAARKTAAEASGRRVPQLRAVETDRPATEAAAPIWTDSPFSGDGQLGRGGLRLSFWLCGFHAAMAERQGKGEPLTEQEQSLLALSGKDFAALRPLVINQAIARLQAVVNAPELVTQEADGAAAEPGALDLFALDSLRRLARRARELLEEDGPDAALNLFGKGAGVQEPLAIFQMVFSTALGLVEAFEGLVPSDSRLLPRLGEALGSEIERI
jgi:hypothetical protein